MSVLVVIALSVAGGGGAAARFICDALIRAQVRSALPIATVTINLVGSFALGLLAGSAAVHSIETAYAIVGTGFLGGFTTFSTASVETVHLALDRRRTAAVAIALGTLGAAVALAAAGMGLGLR